MKQIPITIQHPRLTSELAHVEEALGDIARTFAQTGRNLADLGSSLTNGLSVTCLEASFAGLRNAVDNSGRR